MAKKCPKCGETVSNRKWLYLTKMCRRCDWQFRGKFLAKKRNIKAR